MDWDERVERARRKGQWRLAAWKEMHGIASPREALGESAGVFDRALEPRAPPRAPLPPRVPPPPPKARVAQSGVFPKRRPATKRSGRAPGFAIVDARDAELPPVVERRWEDE